MRTSKIRSKRSIIGLLMAVALTMATAMVLPSPAHASYEEGDTEFVIVNTNGGGGTGVVIPIQDVDCPPFAVGKGMGTATATFTCGPFAGTGPLGVATITLTCDAEWDPWPVDETTTLDLDCTMTIVLLGSTCVIAADLTLPANFLNGPEAGWWQDQDVEGGFGPAGGVLCNPTLGGAIDAIIAAGTDIGMGFTFYDPEKS